MIKKYETSICSNQDGLELSVLWLEPEKEPKGILQISHGMSEYKERYLPFMRYLCERGYLCAIHDHRGHGKSVKYKSDLGYMYGGKDDALVEDLHQVSVWLKDRYPNLTFYMLGHSMGSLIARNYLKQYDYELEKLILTGPPCENPAADLGLLISRAEKRVSGAHHKSKLLELMAFGPYALKFKGESSRSSWVCSGKEVVRKYDESEYCGFTFSADAFESLMLLMKETYSKKGWKLKNKELPILFLAGADDPCAGGGRKFVKELQFMKSIGYRKVTGKMYPDMRHEILNETKKELVYENIYEYLERKNRR